MCWLRQPAETAGGCAAAPPAALQLARQDVPSWQAVQQTEAWAASSVATLAGREAGRPTEREAA